jgi:hypothetical protein
MLLFAFVAKLDLKSILLKYIYNQYLSASTKVLGQKKWLLFVMSA